MVDQLWINVVPWPMVGEKQTLIIIMTMRPMLMIFTA